MGRLFDEKGNEVSSGYHGWQGLHGMKLDMLSQYEVAKRLQETTKVQVNAGKVAEAAFRKWLASFLPRRWGVCSGRIISQKLTGEDPAPHYDVIIYDQLESPVIWIEESPDLSASGMSMAIPVEYVGAVIEVKATFNKRSAQAAKVKLLELQPFLGQDNPDEKYKGSLPRNFSMHQVFFEDGTNGRFEIVENALILARGYMPPLILKIDDDSIYSASFDFYPWEYERHGVIRSEDGRWNNSIVDVEGKTFCLVGGIHAGSFQRFAFGLVELLKGTFEYSRLPSFHALPPWSYQAYIKAKNRKRGK